MDELIARVSASLGVDADLAKTAIGHVLAFLHKELPEGPVAEFIEKVPGARDLVDAVANKDEGAGSSILGGLLNNGLMGLAGRLNAAGLDMGQIQKLGHEIFAYAEGLLGKEKVQQIASSVPGLSQFL
jgi:hypothetical protein